MDPISQGALGASASLLFAEKKDYKVAGFVGVVAGMLPDADVFIQSSSNPLLSLQFHRHFTHSLLFVPFGAFVAALVCYFLFYRKTYDFRKIYLYSVVAFSTHALLDACTSYGTQLLWPFQSTRFAWNVIAIIDPIYTLPLLVGIFFIFWKQKKNMLVFCFCMVHLYLLFGFFQKSLVERTILQHAESRGHVVDELFVNPTPLNRVLWKSIYKSEGVFYTDAISVPYFSDQLIVVEGESQKIDLEGVAAFPKGSRHQKDLQIYYWFSSGFMSRYPEGSRFIGDFRYSILPHKLEPLWGIEVDPLNTNSHVKKVNRRSLESDRGPATGMSPLTLFKNMLFDLESTDLKTYSYPR